MASLEFWKVVLLLEVSLIHQLIKFLVKIPPILPLLHLLPHLWNRKGNQRSLEIRTNSRQHMRKKCIQTLLHIISLHSLNHNRKIVETNQIRLEKFLLALLSFDLTAEEKEENQHDE